MRERTEAYEYRKKFYPGAGPTPSQAGLDDASLLSKGGSYGGTQTGYGN